MTDTGSEDQSDADREKMPESCTTNVKEIDIDVSNCHENCNIEDCSRE